MRTALLAVVAATALTLAVRAAAPQKIVFTKIPRSIAALHELW